MANQERNFSLTAFLIGGIFGACAALILTPKSGKELRADIKRQADNYLREARSKADNLIQSSKTTGELLKRKAGDLMETVKLYAKGKIQIPYSIVEKEIAGIKAAINAAKISYSVSGEMKRSKNEGDNGQSLLIDFDDETLPKQIGMGKGRSRKSFYS